MEKAEQSRKKSHHWLRIWRAVLARLLLVAVVLIIAVTALSGYAISKYKQDYYSNSMRVCDIMAKDFTEYNAQNPQLDLWQEYIPKSVNKVAEQMHVFLYVFNADGSCRIASSNSSIAAADLTLNNEMLAGIRKGVDRRADAHPRIHIHPDGKRRRNHLLSVWCIIHQAFESVYHTSLFVYGDPVVYTAADCGRSDLLSGMARQFAAGTAGSCIAALCTGQLQPAHSCGAVYQFQSGTDRRTQ